MARLLACITITRIGCSKCPELVEKISSTIEDIFWQDDENWSAKIMLPKSEI